MTDFFSVGFSFVAIALPVKAIIIKKTIKIAIIDFIIWFIFFHLFPLCNVLLNPTSNSLISHKEKNIVVRIYILMIIFNILYALILNSF